MLADAKAVAGAAATAFLVAAAEAIERRGSFRVALSGGSTPALLYEELARRVGGGAYVPDWEKVQVFWGDERFVPWDDEESNFGNARAALVEGIGIPEEALFPIPTELPSAETAARAYEALLAHETGTPAGVVPRLDLVLLGMGTDGHTASLFPGSSALGERKRQVVAVEVDMPTRERVTMTFPMLNEARRVAFLVTGRGKAEALRAVLEPLEDEPELPAARVRPRAAPLWFVDGEAGHLLSERERE